MSADIDLTAFSEMIFGDSRVKFWSESRFIPCIFYNKRVTTSVDIQLFSPTKRPIPVVAASWNLEKPVKKFYDDYDIFVGNKMRCGPHMRIH